MRYDIRSSKQALKTLVNLSGVNIATWNRLNKHMQEYRYSDDFVEAVINEYGHFPNSYTDFEYVFFHVTTSANGCQSIKQNGILDLQRSYQCMESELRSFLDSHGVYVDLDNQLLMYKKSTYDISYHPFSRTRQYTLEDYCKSIGRKFYYDYTVCGFLSVWEDSPYGGQVHRQPEILIEIDNLLRTELSMEWSLSHSPYEVVATINGDCIVYDGDDNDSENEMVLNYLMKAYHNAFWKPSEQIVLLKNSIEVFAENIIEVKPLSYWK